MSKAADAPQVSILWAGIDQAEDLARLHAPLFDVAWDGASFARLLRHPGSPALVARVGSPPRIVGCIVGQVAADEAEILSLGVAKDWQRLGIARQLVAALGRAAKRAEARRLYLEVAEGNAAARALYSRLGFQEGGRRKGYYARAGAPAEDAINLWLAL
jgi:ribosomal-protein-alanine N-acetyltransferase